MLLRPEEVERLQLVGYGGFGSVYKGWCKKLSMDIAVKMIDASHGSDMKSLMREKEMMSRASYTYVLRLLGLYETEDRAVYKYGLVMEYMPYGSVCTLFHCIKHVPWALRFQILHQVALGMNYLHHILEPPIIHRDLKRQNILISKSLDVQLTDFGLAKNEVSVSSSPSMAGTVSHMPPEALESLTYKPTKEFDVYSYAILTWSVLSGHEPYENKDRDMIKMLIPHNSRPDMNLVNQWTFQKMVLEAIQLMQECWDADPGKRPSFSVVIKRTNDMNASYAGEIHNDIMKVLDQLKNHNSLHSQTAENRVYGTSSDPKSSVPDSSTFDLSNFRDKLQQVEKEGAEAPDDHKLSTADFLMKNIATVIKHSGDYKKVVNQLDNQGILTEDELQQLNASQNVKDMGSIAGKFLLTKSQEKPEAILKFLKKLF
ncbi:receptor-interacting serine/threonine-protein kinase 4-like isoform X2 [Eleutherodactylus coqui]|uniref:receptor-interacting serine/threonine-protein kinase 4-like isoform X2 n=1 Tax=Eleutherodactylus coqui TaxID=57060 RepID=UPI0034631DD3